jgi:hypothetical protein
MDVDMAQQNAIPPIKQWRIIPGISCGFYTSSWLVSIGNSIFLASIRIVDA